MHATRHKGLAVGQYDVLAAATHQRHGGTVWSKCLAERLEKVHGCDVTGEERLSKNGPLTNIQQELESCCESARLVETFEERPELLVALVRQE